MLCLPFEREKGSRHFLRRLPFSLSLAQDVDQLILLQAREVARNVHIAECLFIARAVRRAANKVRRQLVRLRGAEEVALECQGRDLSVLHGDVGLDQAAAVHAAAAQHRAGR